MMLRALRRLLHRHRWETFWYRGNVWTRCSGCGEWRLVDNVILFPKLDRKFPFIAPRW